MTDIEAIALLDSSRLMKNVIRKYPELEEFLRNRYNDIPKSDTWYVEAVWRLRRGIDVRPVCPVCGKPVQFIGSEATDKIGKTKNGYRKACSKECCYVNPERAENISKVLANVDQDAVQKKREATMLERYGATTSTHIPEFNEKRKKTMIERYGAATTLQSKVLADKVKATVQERYGVDNVFQAEEIKEKLKATNRERYGTDYYISSEEGRQNNKEKQRTEEVLAKRKATSIERYGTENWMQSEAVKSKARETRLANGTVRGSKQEDMVFELLNQLYPGKVERQYCDLERYPWLVDFYIPELDLFIEYNGGNHHGAHRFEPGDPEDEERLKAMEAGNINTKTWTEWDPMKQQTAWNNNIKYIALYMGWHKSWLTYTKSPVKERYTDTLLQRLQSLIDESEVNRFHIVGEDR